MIGVTFPNALESKTMIGKVVYFNWEKARIEDERDCASKPHKSSFLSVTWTGELLTDRPDLYDCVGDWMGLDGNHIDACDEIFRAYNRVEPGDMADLPIRSMSVGDLVVFDDGELIVCQGMGWKSYTGHSLAFWAIPKSSFQSVG